MKKNKAKISETLKNVRDKFGKESAMTLAQSSKIEIETIPTGSIGLDNILGIGGLPLGRMCEIYGKEASGKTTLALHVIAEAQKLGHVCAFIDAEHALDASYSKRIGVDMDNIIISQPSSGEEALNMVQFLVEDGNVGVIVVDSVAALTPQAEIDGEIQDMQMALQARMMSKAMRKLTAPISRKNVLVIFINQVRVNIGGYGVPETTAGGKALKFYTSVRIEIKRIATIKKGDEATGSRVVAKVVKNKLASPFQKTEFDIVYGKGISKEGELLLIGEKLGVIKKSGANYSYIRNTIYKTQNVGLSIDMGSTREQETKLGYGYDKTCSFLKENPEVAGEIAKSIRKKNAEE